MTMPVLAAAKSEKKRGEEVEKQRGRSSVHKNVDVGVWRSPHFSPE